MKTSLSFMFQCSMYILAALVSFRTAFESFHLNKEQHFMPLYIPGIFAFVSLLGILVTVSISSISLSSGTWWSFFETEEGREIGGLGIVFFEMIIILISGYCIQSF